MINNYLRHRRNLYCVFSLIDSRHSLQKIDLEFLNNLGENQIPFVIAYTKIDKVKKSARDQNVENIERELLEFWETLPQRFVTSAETQHGREEILNFIEEINNN